jgi:hypothetical protein
MQVVYWLVTHPINRFWLKGRDLPRWEYSHVLRACFAAFGLVSLAIAVTGPRH